MIIVSVILENPFFLIQYGKSQIQSKAAIIQLGTSLCTPINDYY